MEQKLSFTDITHQLIENGYDVDIKRHNNLYDAVHITGKDIRGAFCTAHDKTKRECSTVYLNGRIAVDNVHCFDKWRKCPLQLRLPRTQKEMDYLLSRMSHWGSAEGREESNDFHFDPAYYPATI